MAGKEIQRLSFILILTIKPSNINIASPPDDINKTGLKNKPTNSPIAPRISNRMVRSPNFSNLKRLNSFFIYGEIKYEIEYIKKDKLEIKTQEINK